MSQSTDLTLANQSGSAYRAEHNSINAALGSTHIGSSAPSYILTGMHWIDNSGTPWVQKVYDGTDNISWLEINASTNSVNLVSVVDVEAAGSSGVIIKNSGGTAVATIGPANTTNITFAGVVNNTGSLNVSGTSSAPASVSLAEDTDNGTNTVTLIAPASITSNRTLTLPDASGTVALTNADAADFTSGAATDGQVLTADGAGGAAWESVGGSGWVPIKTVTASSVSSVDFVNGSGGVVLDSTYKCYAVVLSQIVPATDNVDFYARFSDDTGATFEATNYSAKLAHTAGASSFTFDSGTIGIRLSNAMGNDTVESYSGVFYLANPSSTTRTKNCWGSSVYHTTSSAESFGLFGGHLDGTAAVDGLRFLMSSGNITSGTFTLYGLKDA